MKRGRRRENGWPDTIGPGDEVSFTIEGDLTIRDITQRATFDIVATVVSETEVQGDGRIGRSPDTCPSL